MNEDEKINNELKYMESIVNTRFNYLMIIISI
jgi:hypothetical protein